MGQRGPIANRNSIRYVDRSKPAKTLADVPVDKLGKAKMPRWLLPDARKFWREHAPGLEQLGRLTALDQVAFAILCESYAWVRKMDAQIDADGMVLTGPRGATRPHPLLRARDQWLRSFLQGCKDFGLTPASRQRLPAPTMKDDPDNPFLTWLEGAKS